MKNVIERLTQVHAGTWEKKDVGEYYHEESKIYLEIGYLSNYKIEVRALVFVVEDKVQATVEVTGKDPEIEADHCVEALNKLLETLQLYKARIENILSYT